LRTLLDPKTKVDDAEFSKENRTWLHRDITFSPEFAKAIYLKVTYVCELPDLFRAMKDILIFVACKSKLATLRSKALKAVKAVVKAQPTLLMDDGIKSLIAVRISDPSTVTREAAIELLMQYFTAKALSEPGQFIDLYLPIILSRSSDRSQMVRRKVTQVLSQMLTMCSEKHYDRVVQELISKWNDSSLQVKSNLTKCLGRILISKMGSPEDAVAFLNRLNKATNCVEEVWASVLEEREVAKRLKEQCDHMVGCCVTTAIANLAGDAEEAIQSLKTLVLLSRVVPTSLVLQL